MTGTIVYWHGICIASFDKLCATLESADLSHGQKVACSSILDEYGRFNVWAGNIGAHQVGRVSLDFRLREAGHIKDQVIKLLQYLSEALGDGNIANSFPGPVLTSVQLSRSSA